QVPPNERWSAEQRVDQSDFSSEELATLAILDSLAVEFNIDPNRVYITVLSMGGHGTWDLIARLPNRFAAAVPMSGRADPTQADEILHLPIWAFHGESDTVVPASGSRGIIYAMENLGRDVLYTECRRSPPLATNYNCPGSISLDSLAEAINAHANLILTSVEDGGHGPWTVWYDHPLLADWLFSKYLVDPNAITIEQPAQSAVWTGTNSITWIAPGPATDVVEVWLSLDNGNSWQKVDETTLGEGSYALDTSGYADTPFAQIRLFVQNERGFIYGRHTSEPFTIDNAGDAPPTLILNDENLRFNPRVTSQQLNLDVLAADPESSMLTAHVFYSIDGGNTFGQVQSVELSSSRDPQTISVPLVDLPNSLEAQLRIELTDGTSSTSATTVVFEKENPREVNEGAPEQVQGEGIGTITLHFVEPENLTGHRYRITFDDANPAAKTYSVTDLDLSTTVLTDVPFSDGVLESPLFDGIRLIVQDPEEGLPNLEETGWIEGDTDLAVSIDGGEVRIAILRVQLLATEEEYELTIAESVIDQSEAMLGFSAQDMRFTVTSRSDSERRPVMFDDTNNDGLPGDGDILYILEEDDMGELAPAWEFRFSATETTILPEPGDTFLFVPLHKLSSDDVFEFTAAVGVGTEDAPVPDEAMFFSSYPNPFTDEITVAYRLQTPSHITLDMYDLLGRRVARLLDAPASAGEHRFDWTADGNDAPRLSSGIYLLRLTITPLDGGPSRSAQRSVVRIH
ncbi:MAG TPA: T9SS type A sorting domain-containing protein, partial [Rhodothermales bacterium]|nr:T9SS type A sorting domain-containing protein [Rhodothermales bacterium]